MENSMIEVTKLNGKKYYLNPHMIETIEENPDVTIQLLSGRKIIVTDKPQELIDRIVAYRRQIGITKQEL